MPAESSRVKELQFQIARLARDLQATTTEADRARLQRETARLQAELLLGRELGDPRRYCKEVSAVLAQFKAGLTPAALADPSLPDTLTWYAEVLEAAGKIEESLFCRQFLLFRAQLTGADPATTTRARDRADLMQATGILPQAPAALTKILPAEVVNFLEARGDDLVSRPNAPPAREPGPPEGDLQGFLHQSWRVPAGMKRQIQANGGIEPAVQVAPIGVRSALLEAAPADWAVVELRVNRAAAGERGVAGEQVLRVRLAVQRGTGRVRDVVLASNSEPRVSCSLKVHDAKGFLDFTIDEYRFRLSLVNVA